jgi:hypothetical protein
VRIRKSAIALTLTLTLGGLSFASLADTVSGDKGSDMLIDLIVLRPIGLASTVVGSAVFVLGLPFTIPSGSVGDSACELIKRPAAYTFTRPLGDLNGSADIGSAKCTKPEIKGHD